MVETYGMAGMLVIAIFALAAVYIIMRLLDRSGGEGGIPAPGTTALSEMSDEEFINSYTGPLLEDAREKLETAIESIRLALDYYGHGAWEEAGSEFHLAARGIDEASGQLKEVVGMVENPGMEPVKRAKARLAECRRLRALAIRMEEACDAMADGKAEEARKLATVKDELEQAASAFKALEE